MRYSVTNATVPQVQAVGATNIKEASSVKVIFAELTDAQVNQLRAQGCSCTPVGKVTTGQTTIGGISPPPRIAALPIYTPTSLISISHFDELRKQYEPVLYGDGMTVAIIGTGIRETHQLIDGRVVYSKNYTTDIMADSFDHDTGVCSILLAMAPKCSILNLKVMDSSGEGTTEAVVLAIDDCLALFDNKNPLAPSLINMSLGAPDTGDPDDPMRVACRAAIDRGIWIAAACGNGGATPGTITSPACERYVFAVGSADVVSMDGDKYGFKVSDYSSRGPTLEGLTKPDAVFFGSDIEMASSASDTATTAKSGTSFATPFLSGIGILYQQGTLLNLPNWRELAAEYLTNVPASELTENLVTAEMIQDKYLQYITIRPAGAGNIKSNDGGWGLPFGDLVGAALRPTPAALDISALIPIMMIPMIGMMTKVVSRYAR